jgi:amidase
MLEPALHDLSLVELSTRLQARELSSTEVTRALLERIAAWDPVYSSFITVLAERSLAQAARADAELDRGESRGPLHGVPLALKDLCETAFAPTTAGMPPRRHFMAPRSATVVERLEDAGAIILGKLAMTEGAFSEHHPEFPRPKNPWSERHWAGTSSSGSGVAVAMGFCFGALGSDTGGSIRYPSACNGVTGLKPTWGRVSRQGIVPLAPSMDHIGPMARTAADCAMLLGAIAGRDPDEPSTLEAAVPDYAADLAAGIAGLRVGFDPEYAEAESAPTVRNALMHSREVLRAARARFIEVRFPATDAVTAAWLPLCAQEAARARRDDYARHAASYGTALAELIRMGASLTPPELQRLADLRQEFRVQAASAFQEIDLLLTPALSRTVPTLESMAASEPRQWIRRFTTPFNLTGQPTITFPAGVDAAGLPIAAQLIAPALGEPLLLRAAHAFQQRTGWHRRRPVANPATMSPR